MYIYTYENSYYVIFCRVNKLLAIVRGARSLLSKNIDIYIYILKY